MIRQEIITDRETNYCEKCWHDFTTLSEEELNNLENMHKHFYNKDVEIVQKAIKHKPKDYVLYCYDNDTYYNTVMEASRDLQLNYVSIYNYINKKCKHEHWQFEWRLRDER